MLFRSPLTWQMLEKVIEVEKPDAVLPTLGGQTALNLAMELHAAGDLDRLGTQLIGADVDAIRKAEDRQLFRDTVVAAGLHVPQSVIVDSLHGIPADFPIPAIVRPAGPVDPAVPVVIAETPAGRPLATYVNFAMHLDTVGGFKFSADYAFTLGRILGAAQSPDMVTLFTIGCAGDINHVNVATKDPQKGPAEAARIGTVLAGEVLKVSTRAMPVATDAPRSAATTVALDLPPIDAADVEKARALIEIGRAHV